MLEFVGKKKLNKSSDQSFMVKHRSMRGRGGRVGENRFSLLVFNSLFGGGTQEACVNFNEILLTISGVLFCFLFYAQLKNLN